jgi:pimeloyl-ACP methyl ester carboxylesterase
MKSKLLAFLLAPFLGFAGTTKTEASTEEMHFQFMNTSEGKIAYVDSKGEGFPIVFIHGNSCSSKVFKKQIAHFSLQHRVVAIDLPGHGKSDRTNHPSDAYTIPGYAKILDEVTKALKLKEFVVVGFSLGGNIALQWTQVTDRIKGVMMVSSAPMKYSEEAFLSYLPYEGSYAASPDGLTESQAKQYMGAGGFDTQDPSVYFMIQDAMKTDGAARATMVASVLAGKGIDETGIVSELVVPLAVVIGDKDNTIGREYISGLHYSNLWHNEIDVLSDARHAIVYHQADRLNSLLENFIRDVLEENVRMAKEYWNDIGIEALWRTK